jgi:phenylacetate-CoA ligase
LANHARPDENLADSIRARVRDVLTVQTSVELVPFGSLPRSEYKSKLVDH